MAQETQDPVVSGAEEGSSAGLEPGLHILSTPIGAAKDLSLRGLAALREADMLVCEDTRVLRKLLDLHGAPLSGRPLLTYHEHNGEAVRPKILAHLAEGRSVVLTSDAGTPLIADPGYKLVRAARAAGHKVTALPGPSAMLAALVISGLPTDAFCFIGFPPTKPGARRKVFERWAAAPGSLVLYEAPRRLAETLRDLADILGANREAAIAREMTKRYEEVRTGGLGALADEIGAIDPLKGEVVVVVGPPEEENADETAIDALLTQLLETHSLKDAVQSAAAALGAPKKLVYGRALVIKGTNHGGDA